MIKRKKSQRRTKLALPRIFRHHVKAPSFNHKSGEVHRRAFVDEIAVQELLGSNRLWFVPLQIGRYGKVPVFS